MPPGHGSRAKPLEWSPRAWDAYSATLAYIADEDPFAAQLVKDRVERALTQIAEFPELGTPAMPRGVRRFPIPNTGHAINYRVIRGTIRVQTWYRARQRTTRSG
jgi:plasmid stabilization system protein ParE